MTTDNTNIGSFKVLSGKLVVSDPCYTLDSSCHGMLDNVRNGTWNASLMISDEGNWGMRVAELIVHHTTAKTVRDSDWRILNTKIGVDSGQAGFFDPIEFNSGKTTSDDEWYDRVCNLTLSDGNGGVLTAGAVSSSGYGDGEYTAYYAVLDGEVVAAKIVFVEDDLEDSDED